MKYINKKTSQDYDQIKITDLEVFANHGVFPEENKLGQKFLISAVLYTFITKYMNEHTYQLLERAAETLAEEMLKSISGLCKIDLEIKKPWAPVGLPLKTVSVKISREWHTTYIALGSNIGDSETYLNEAVEKIGQIPTCTVEKVSSYLVTEPYGVTDQPDFLNACLKMRTLLYPEELLKELNRIEKEAGRERIIHWGPRTLDLDILLYDDIVLEEDDLCIPHVEMHKRSFVLEPLAEIAPYKRHPVYGKTVREMLEEIQAQL